MLLTGIPKTFFFLLKKIAYLNRYIIVTLLYFVLDEKKSLKNEEHIIVTLFISSGNGIRIHDVMAADQETRLISCATPYIVSLQKLSIVREIMSDFNGLEKCDSTTRDAVLEFSYNLSLGE